MFGWRRRLVGHDLVPSRPTRGPDRRGVVGLSASGETVARKRVRVLRPICPEQLGTAVPGQRDNTRLTVAPQLKPMCEARGARS